MEEREKIMKQFIIIIVVVVVGKWLGCKLDKTHRII
jgi:hypothetical protein